MGGSNTKIEWNAFKCNGQAIPPSMPLKFKTLKHMRCIFFSQDAYDSRLHIPTSSLTLEFDSSVANLENDIDVYIKNVFDKMNAITGTSDIKVLSPIYIAFSRKLEYSSSVFDDPSIKKVEIEKPDKTDKLAITEVVASFFNKSPDENLEKKYKSLPMNIYNFNNKKIKVIMYFPFMTNQYKYITNFDDIISSTSWLVNTLLETSFNGLPDVNTFDENKIRKNIEKMNILHKKKNIPLITPEQINNIVNFYTTNLKEVDKTNFRYRDDLIYLCNEGGCLSESSGEDFNTLLPSLASTDSDNDNSANNMSPFLPNKCLAQTIRYKCGIINADKDNVPIHDLMKSEPIIDYLTSNLRKYKINQDCYFLDKKTASQSEINYCNKSADKNPNFNQTPVDIINNALSFQLRALYNSDFNEKEDKNENKYNHYSKNYSTNIIKELMLLRNTYPGIQEIVFPLYKYIGKSDYIIEPPWGTLFLTYDHIMFYNENIPTSIRKYSFNNQYYLKMNSKGYIYVKRHSNDQIIYFLNLIPFSKPLTMAFTETISITFKDDITGNENPKNVLDSSIKIINKSDKLREPFNLYLNDEGKIRVYANGFLDATDKSFVKYIDDKINEYNNYGNNPEYYDINNYSKKNKLNKNKLYQDEAIYID